MLGGSNSRIIGAAANARISEYCQIDRDTFCEKARNANSFTIPSKDKFNDYKEETFSYFFSQFINEVIGDFTEYKISFFKLIIKQNIKHYFNLFVNIFNKFDKVFSGHYHHRSHSDNIYYLGNPYELTWQDYDDQRGFHLFDLSTQELEFIPNTNVMFHKVYYDDKENTISEITGKDLGKFTGTYVKVVVLNKTNPYLFDRFMANLYDVNPVDITIAEDIIDLTEGLDDDIVNQAEDTVSIINKFVDGIKEEHIDNDKLKSVLKELYIEALNLEQA